MKVRLSKEEIVFLKNHTKYAEDEIKILFDDFIKKFPSGKITEDDFVDLSELPPLPQKHLPVLHPKQKINKSQSTRRRIDMALLAKYKTQSSSFNSSFEDYDMVDYDDPEKLAAAAAAEVVVEEDEEQMDYDEPIPLHAHLL